MKIQFHTLASRDINTVQLNKDKLSLLGVELLVIENKNKTIQQGRMRAIELSEADFISSIDDDDETLLTQEHLDKIRQLKFDCLFTNSFVKTGNFKRPLIRTDVKEWSVDKERKGLITPHQTYFLNKDTYKRICIEAAALINNNFWHENMFDFVVRVLISKYKLWTYYPKITYLWNNDGACNHKQFVSYEHIEIRTFIKGI